MNKSIEDAYRQLIHILWHALDDAEEHQDGSMTIPPEHMKKINRFVPSDHPSPVSGRLISAAKEQPHV